VPYPHLVSRLRHHLDMANAKAALGDYGEACTSLQHVRAQAPEWLAQQRYARDILAHIISHRRTLTPGMRDLADTLNIPL